MTGDIYVIYLQFEEKLDERFFYLTRVFQQFGISLIPVTVDEFKEIRHCEGEYVLALVRDIASYEKYRRLLKRYMNYSLRTGKMTLIEASSFTVFHDNKLLKNKNVFQYRLPISMFSVASDIGEIIYTNLTTESKKWPGGKRAKLPTV